MMRGEGTFVIADLLESPPYHAGDALVRAIVDLAGARSVIISPLRKDAVTLGAITIYRQEVRPFSNKQIALLENFAAQAVIAMENARLIDEQREALEQQTATAEVLQVINASPGNLTPVFDAMLEKAMRLCGAAFGLLATDEDGRGLHTVATRGVPAAYAAFRSTYRATEQIPLGALTRAIETKRRVHVLDMKTHEAYLAGVVPARAGVDLGGVRTVLHVPLLRDEVVRGMFTIYRQEVRAFSDKEIALLENFAAQAVIAMENARLMTEQREALEQQTATAEILRVISRSLTDVQPTFDTIAAAATTLTDAALSGIVTYDGRLMHLAASSGFTADEVDKLRGLWPIAADHGTATGRAILTRQVVQIEEISTDPEYAYPTLARSSGQTVLAVPMLRDGISIGAINVQRRHVEQFTVKQIELFKTFADQAVIAIENVRLVNELNERTCELQEALEHQTGTAEVLQVINSSPGDLAPVFEAILEKAHTLCGADVGTLTTFDGEHFQTVAAQRLPEAFASTIRRPFRPTAMQQALIRGDRLNYIPDTRAVVGAHLGVAGYDYLEQTGVRTFLQVPLRKDGTLLGFIGAHRLEVRPYSESEIALLENFAAQAVIAMENARLIDEQREALEQQTATAEVLQVINASPGNLTPVFDTMLENAMRLCEAAFGLLYTTDGERFDAAAHRGIPHPFAEYLAQRSVQPLPHGPLRRSIAAKRPILVPDMRDEEVYQAGHPGVRALVELGGARTNVIVPLLKDNVVVGLFSIYRQEVRPFANKQITLLESFAAQAVIAIENARLLQELRTRTDQLAQRQAELRVTFENMGDGVAMFDETTRLVAWNRKFQDILDLPDGVLAEHLTFPDYIRYLVSRGEFGARADPDAELRRITEHSGEHYVLERARPDGRVIEIRRNPVARGGFVINYADITERKRNEAAIAAARDAAEEASRTIEAAYRDLKAAQANLIQAEKMASLGQLTAGIAHEIKNPLNFVNNFSALSTELIDELRDVLAPEALSDKVRAEVDDLTTTLKGNLEKVVQHGKRADGIVKSMLEHSRGASGERRTVDLNALVDEALNLAYHGARAQDQSFNITLERNFGDEIAPIELNPQDITRVFLNLFSNGFYAANKRACDGAEPGFEPTLKVTTRDLGRQVEIGVRDNGTGIPAGIRDKLFQPFFTTKPTGEGTGLGLSITYDIVTKAHGGAISVDSEVGDHTEFTIHLPREMFADDGGRA